MFMRSKDHTASRAAFSLARVTALVALVLLPALAIQTSESRAQTREAIAPGKGLVIMGVIASENVDYNLGWFKLKRPPVGKNNPKLYDVDGGFMVKADPRQPDGKGLQNRVTPVFHAIQLEPGYYALGKSMVAHTIPWNPTATDRKRYSMDTQFTESPAWFEVRANETVYVGDWMVDPTLSYKKHLQRDTIRNLVRFRYFRSEPEVVQNWIDENFSGHNRAVRVGFAEILSMIIFQTSKWTIYRKLDANVLANGIHQQ